MRERLIDLFPQTFSAGGMAQHVVQQVAEHRRRRVGARDDREHAVRDDLAGRRARLRRGLVFGLRGSNVQRIKRAARVGDAAGAAYEVVEEVLDLGAVLCAAARELGRHALEGLQPFVCGGDQLQDGEDPGDLGDDPCAAGTRNVSDGSGARMSLEDVLYAAFDDVDEPVCVAP